ncbi:MAG: outer membrane protein assembly factor BamD [Bdellovibrionales bacterium]|nr:outer membrane protein assembly factor BamD [Bdellovibrionales bacterium]
MSILLLVSFAAAGCSSVDKFDPSTAEGAYKLAEQYEKDERFEEAVGKYADVKNKHPYSRFATMAELKIADVHFTRESYIEAQYAYQTFKELHPKHPQIDYVTFRLGMSFFNQLPSTIDRDLSLADKAILYFDEVIASYPQSQYAKEARDKRTESLKKLAGKELYIADFYFKKKQYGSALGRYEGLLRSYANVEGFAAPALYRAAISARETGDRDKAGRYAKRLIQRFPDSTEAAQARSEFSNVR